MPKKYYSKEELKKLFEALSKDFVFDHNSHIIAPYYPFKANRAIYIDYNQKCFNKIDKLYIESLVEHYGGYCFTKKDVEIIDRVIGEKWELSAIRVFLIGHNVQNPLDWSWPDIIELMKSQKGSPAEKTFVDTSGNNRSIEKSRADCNKILTREDKHLLSYIEKYQNLVKSVVEGLEDSIYSWEKTPDTERLHFEWPELINQKNCDWIIFQFLAVLRRANMPENIIATIEVANKTLFELKKSGFEKYLNKENDLEETKANLFKTYDLLSQYRDEKLLAIQPVEILNKIESFVSNVRLLTTILKEINYKQQSQSQITEDTLTGLAHIHLQFRIDSEDIMNRQGFIDLPITGLFCEVSDVIENLWTRAEAANDDKLKGNKSGYISIWLNDSINRLSEICDNISSFVEKECDKENLKKPENSDSGRLKDESANDNVNYFPDYPFKAGISYAEQLTMFSKDTPMKLILQQMGGSIRIPAGLRRDELDVIDQVVKSRMMGDIKIFLVKNCGYNMQNVCELSWDDIITALKYSKTKQQDLTSIKSRFTIEESRILFDGKDLNLPTGRTIEIAKMLIENFNTVVKYKLLDNESSDKEATDNLRKYKSDFDKALKTSNIPCIVKTKKQSGYILTAK